MCGIFALLNFWKYHHDKVEIYKINSGLWAISSIPIELVDNIDNFNSRTSLTNY